MDVLKQIAAVVAHREVKGAVEAPLLLAQSAHLMVPCSRSDTKTNRSISIWQQINILTADDEEQDQFLNLKTKKSVCMI